MIPFEDSTTLSLLFHLNSEPWMNTAAYDQSAYSVEYRELLPPEQALNLPHPEPTPLLKLMKTRSSCRSYQRRTMPLETLATLLGGACGITRLSEVSPHVKAYFRTAPSAGGLFPLETYLTARDIEGVADGLYHYAVQHHSLELMKSGSLAEERYGSLLADPFVHDANLVVFLTAVFMRTQRKYGPRGYRYVLLEAGHVAQNLCLLAAEQGLGSLCIGGFVDSKLNRFLNLDGMREAAVYAVGVGYSNSPGSEVPGRS